MRWFVGVLFLLSAGLFAATVSSATPDAIPGPSGPPGSDGESIVGPRGLQGDPGLSIMGPQGLPGADSTAPGPQGTDGADGVGRDGSDGTDGTAGSDGTSVVGPPGPAGQDSTVPGPQGLQGLPGPSPEMVIGNVNANGTIFSGEGFSVVRIAAGRYQLNFATPFTAPPSMMVTPVLGSPSATQTILDFRVVTVDQITETTAVIVTGGSTASIGDSAFGFLALGALVEQEVP